MPSFDRSRTNLPVNVSLLRDFETVKHILFERATIESVMGPTPFDDPPAHAFQLN